MRALTVCVDYADYLALSLPRMLRHFHRVMVVTTGRDEATNHLIDMHWDDGARIWRTEVFYEGGAFFNKGAAVEEGFGAMGRQGWLAVVDADVLLPDVEIKGLERGNLYSAPRRMCRGDEPYKALLDAWKEFPLRRDIDYGGWLQIFHAGDPVLKERPWYTGRYRHAGGCDTDFQARWPEERRRWLPFEVLHLGDECRNWCGRASPQWGQSPTLEMEERARNMRSIWEMRRAFGDYPAPGELMEGKK